MTRRVTSEERLKLLLGVDPATPTVVSGEDHEVEQVPSDTAADPDVYGVRVVWQSEAELLEAAEFLVATRVRSDASMRVLNQAHAHHAPEATEDLRADQDHG